MTGAKRICSWIRSKPCEVDLALEMVVIPAEKFEACAHSKRFSLRGSATLGGDWKQFT
jgi:hypothetical protein